MRVFINAYHVNVYNKKDKLILSRMLDGTDFLDYVDGVLNTIAPFSKDYVEHKTYSVDKQHKHGRLLYGVFDYGEYGYGADIKNITSHETTYQKSPEEAEMLSFVYMLYVPEGYDTAILVLQKNGNIGIKGVVEYELCRDLGDTMEKRIEIASYLDTKVLSDFLDNGEVKALRFMRHSLPKDLADRVDENPCVSTDALIEFRISHATDKQLRKLLGEEFINKVRSGENVSNVFDLLSTVTPQGFDCEGLKIEVEKPELKRKKVFELFNTEGFAESRQVLANDSNIKNGLPTLEYVSIQAFNYISEICSKLNIASPTKPKWFFEEEK